MSVRRALLASPDRRSVARYASGCAYHPATLDPQRLRMAWGHAGRREDTAGEYGNEDGAMAWVVALAFLLAWCAPAAVAWWWHWRRKRG
jgi:hypothetical protein